MTPGNASEAVPNTCNVTNLDEEAGHGDFGGAGSSLTGPLTICDWWWGLVVRRVRVA